MRFLLLLCVGCGNTPAVPDATTDATVDAPMDAAMADAKLNCATQGRTTAMACSNAMRPAANDGLDAGGDANACVLDNECIAGSGGRCNELVSGPWCGFNPIGTRCTYDTCHSDGECEAGVCGCEIGFAKQHLCLSRSNCKTNADCASGVCAFSTVAVLPPPCVVITGSEIATVVNSNEGTLGWFCTTPGDECCPGSHGDAGSVSYVCVYSSQQKRWLWAGLP